MQQKNSGEEFQGIINELLSLDNTVRGIYLEYIRRRNRIYLGRALTDYAIRMQNLEEFISANLLNVNMYVQEWDNGYTMNFNLENFIFEKNPQESRSVILALATSDIIRANLSYFDGALLALYDRDNKNLKTNFGKLSFNKKVINYEKTKIIPLGEPGLNAFAHDSDNHFVIKQDDSRVLDRYAANRAYGFLSSKIKVSALILFEAPKI
jgi:hypothetical protein